jgi:hypothetical protein
VRRKSDRVAVPQLRRPAAGSPPQRPGYEPGSSHVGSVVDRAAMGEVSLEYLGFTCQSFLSLIAPQSSSSSIIQCWYNRPINGRSNSGLCSTQSHI